MKQIYYLVFTVFCLNRAFCRQVITEKVTIIFDNSSQSLSPEGEVILNNPNLKGLKAGVLHHLAMSTETHDLPEIFGDVKFICIGGTVARMKIFAKTLAKELDIHFDGIDHAEKSHRFALFKVGPVISVNGGMGTPSWSIVLHELIKLAHYSKMKNVVFIRIGTSGGIGVEPGTVVVSDVGVDGLIRPFYELYIMGEIVRRPAILDKDLVSEFKLIAEKEIKEFPVVSGATLGAMDFYEGEGRIDGAFSDRTPEQKMQFLDRLHREGVVNMEMESIAFASMTYKAGIKSAIICVTLIDRLKGDQIRTSHKLLDEYQVRPMTLISKFIKKRLAMSNKAMTKAIPMID